MSLDKIISKFESLNELNEDDLAYSCVKKYTKDDIIKTIKQYSDELFCKTYKNGQQNLPIYRFVKSIQDYIKDEDVLVELFKANGKGTMDVISSSTDLLKKDETKLLVYRAAIKRKR